MFYVVILDIKGIILLLFERSKKNPTTQQTLL